MWGKAYSPDALVPELTLQGKNIKQVALSDDMILALSKDGSLYKFPIAKELQRRNDPSSITYRQMKPDGLGYFERCVFLLSQAIPL